MMDYFYQQISAAFPRVVVNRVSVLMVQGGFESISARTFLGFATFFTLSAALSSFFIAPFLFKDATLQAAVPLLVLIGSAVIFYLMLVMTADTRAGYIEKVLPDAMLIMSANIRSGMTLENAIWSAARPEFGPLRDEIKRVSSDTFSGAPVGDTLSRMSKRVRSAVLDRSVKLINEGIRLGGEMSPLLEAVASDIRNTGMLRKEIATSTLTYVIFIIFAGVLASPLLFSVSTFYSEMNDRVLQKQAKSVGGQDSDKMRAAQSQSGLSGVVSIGGGSRKPDPQAVTPADVYWFSVFCIIVTTASAGLILGLVQQGKAMAGIKFVPIFVLLALGIYHLALGGMRAAFAGLMGS